MIELTDIIISEDGQKKAVKKLIISSGEVFVQLICELEDGTLRSYGAFRQEV